MWNRVRPVVVYRPVVGCQTNCAISKLTFTKYNGNGFSWLAIDSGVMLGGSVICRSYSGVPQTQRVMYRKQSRESHSFSFRHYFLD